MVKAKTIMSENVITINENATLEDAAKLITGKNVSSLLVIKNDKPIATVTTNDLVKGIIQSKKVKVKDIMGKAFLTINPDTTYSHIAKKVKNEKIVRFPVVENNKIVGIITETDVVDATRNFTRFHQIMQEVILAVFGLVTAFFLIFFSPIGQSIIKALG